MDSSFLHRRESIVLTAIEIIDELGIKGLSTREIAKRQGISEGTLFRHYKNKNEIITEVLNHYSQYDYDIAESVRLMNLKPKESIIYLIKAYSEYYENYPSITAIPNIYEVLIQNAELAEKVKSIYNNRRNYMKEIIKSGQKSGEIIPDIDAQNLSDVMLGFFRETVLRWRINGYSFSLKDSILTTFKTILDVFSQRNNS